MFPSPGHCTVPGTLLVRTPKRILPKCTVHISSSHFSVAIPLKVALKYEILNYPPQRKVFHLLAFWFCICFYVYLFIYDLVFASECAMFMGNCVCLCVYLCWEVVGVCMKVMSVHKHVCTHLQRELGLHCLGGLRQLIQQRILPV